MNHADLQYSDAVKAALHNGGPIVALESTIISHGFPRPQNLDAARKFEKVLVDAGVTPATIALIGGVPHIGLNDDEIVRIAEDESVVKVSSRDLAIAVTQKVTGATTVAATAHLAHMAGIRVFSTGGLGGVHRGAVDTFDESADLTVVSHTPITIVSAGAKSILDIQATLERLETLGTTVVGYKTSHYPGFYISDSGYEIDWRVESAEEVATIMEAQDRLNLTSAVLVANPLPKEQQLDPELHDRVLAEALADAQAAGIGGKEVTPFVLAEFVKKTEGKSLDVNIDIACNNIVLGASIAKAWAAKNR